MSKTPITQQQWNTFTKAIQDGHSPYKGTPEKPSAVSIAQIPQPVKFKEFVDENPAYAAVVKKLDDKRKAVVQKEEIEFSFDFQLEEVEEVPVSVNVTQEDIIGEVQTQEAAVENNEFAHLQNMGQFFNKNN